jgi:hypothetical protein
MYSYPIYLPEVSNREDLILTVALFDDDTGEALDFSGTVRAQPGDYTNNFWLVTDGPFASTSLSVLTIPDYPIGAQLQSVALTVLPNMNFFPGDPVTIANLPGGAVVVGPIGPPPIPLLGEDGITYLVTENSASTLTTGPPSAIPVGPNTMTGYITSYAPATGALVCQIGSTFQFEIRPVKRGNDFDYGYSASWDFSGTYDDHPLITASLGNGLTMAGQGVLQVRIPELTFRKLRHRTYAASLTMTDSYDTRQVFVARLPTQYGGVSL